MGSIPEFSLFNRETSSLNELLPREIRKNSSTFVNLLEEYYRFLNQKDNPSYVIQRIIDEHDLDKVIDSKYLDKIQYEIARGIPTSSYVQKAFLLKRIIDSYGIRGNDESVLYFFRIFFNEDVSIYNPWERVIHPSQGLWKSESSIDVVLYFGNESSLIGKTLIQYDENNTTLASVVIEKVEKKSFYNRIYYTLKIRVDTLSGNFSNGFEVKTEDGLALGKIIRSLDSIKIVNSGQNYSIGDKLYFGEISDITFYAIVDRVGLNGEILNISIKDNGVSSSIDYYGDAKNINIPNLSEIYLSGILKYDSQIGKYYIETLAENNNTFYVELKELEKNIDLPFHVNQVISATGILNSNIIILNDLFKKTNTLILHDFEFYESNAINNLDNSENFKPIDSYTLVFNTKNINAGGASFLYSFKHIYSSANRYENEYGRPSGYSVLQDSFYYQVFSYEISSIRSISEWKTSYESLIHPAGTKLFGNLNALFNIKIITDSELKLLFGINENFIPKNVTAEEDITLKGGINVLAQNYGGVDDNEEPYFLEDYTSSLVLSNDLVFDSYNLIFDGIDLIFTISTGTNFGGFEQKSRASRSPKQGVNPYIDISDEESNSVDLVEII